MMTLQEDACMGSAIATHVVHRIVVWRLAMAITDRMGQQQCLMTTCIHLVSVNIVR